MKKIPQGCETWSPVWSSSWMSVEFEYPMRPLNRPPGVSVCLANLSSRGYRSPNFFPINFPLGTRSNPMNCFSSIYKGQFNSLNQWGHDSIFFSNACNTLFNMIDQKVQWNWKEASLHEYDFLGITDIVNHINLLFGRKKSWCLFLYNCCKSCVIIHMLFNGSIF